jgi:SAM-dependent methyltransferase
MKTALHEALLCPTCGSDLDLEAFEWMPQGAAGDVVKTGVLRCAACRTWYPIINCVPVMLDFESPLHAHFQELHSERLKSHAEFGPPHGTPRAGEHETQRSFTTEWSGLVNDELSFSYTQQDREDFLRIELDWPGWPLQHQNYRLLDVGCGYGLESVILNRLTGAQVFGVDLNLSLLESGPQFATLPDVHVAVASLFALPFRKDSFDLVYSHGVLHHTYSTRQAFETVLSYLNDHGMIYIWVYGLEDFARTFKLRFSYSVEMLVRPTLARLPTMVQAVWVYPMALMHLLNYRRGGFNRDKWHFKNSVHTIRDRWTCRFAYRQSFHEVLGWFLERGLHANPVNSYSYLKRFGHPLIGVGMRGSRRDNDGGLVAPESN